MSHIFISYSRKDKDCAYKIQRQLEAQGYKIWIDKNDIPAGAPFPMEILKGIREASVIMIMWSTHAAQSHFVGKEIEEALTQKMINSTVVIPVWLDDEPLPEGLQALNAVSVQACDDAQIDSLEQKIPEAIRKALGRQKQAFDPHRLLHEQDATRIPNTALYAVPLLKSWFCQAHLIGKGDLVVSEHLTRRDPKPIICVVPQFLGDTDDATITQVYRSFQEEVKEEEQPFICVHIKPNTSGRILINIAEQGQALDAIGTTFQAVYDLVNRNRNLATLKIFTPMMSALSGMIGHVFDSFWHVQEYHFVKNEDRYYLLVDSKDL